MAESAVPSAHASPSAAEASLPSAVEAPGAITGPAEQSQNGGGATAEEDAEAVARRAATNGAIQQPGEDKERGTIQTPSQAKPIVSDRQRRLTRLATRTKELDATVADLTAQRTNLLSQFSRLSATRQTAGEASSAESLTPSSLPPSQSSDEALAGPDADVLVLRARSITDRHITLLHSYNAVRDVGQALFGFIADGRDVRLRDVHADFDMELTD